MDGYGYWIAISHCQTMIQMTIIYLKSAIRDATVFKSSLGPVEKSPGTSPFEKQMIQI